MKILFKLSIVAVILVLVVSSCLKADDPLLFQTSNTYILQIENGKFIPQMRVEGDKLKYVSLSIGGSFFSFNQNPSNIWELSTSLNGLDSITSMSTLKVTGISGKIETNQIGFSPAIKKIGDIDVGSLVYNSTDHRIYIKLNSEVENAEIYYLLIKYPFGERSYTMWIPYPFSFVGNTLSTSVSFEDLKEGGTYKFAVGAGYGSVIKIGKEIEATMAK